MAGMKELVREGKITPQEAKHALETKCLLNGQTLEEAQATGTWRWLDKKARAGWKPPVKAEVVEAALVGGGESEDHDSVAVPAV